MNAAAIWENSLNEIKESVNQVGYTVYIQGITPVSVDNNVMTLAVSMNIHKNMIEKRYTDAIKSALTHCAGFPMDINIIVDSEPEKLKETISENENPGNTSDIEDGFKSINQKYTFDTFVIGSSNEYAHAASLNTAKNPGRINPLFLYGNSGLGKTHLMCAIGNYIFKKIRISILFTFQVKSLQMTLLHR